MSRPSYGGRLRLSLPLRLSRLDPHDPEDLSCALLGQSLFETLFSLSSRGLAYPTLASHFPTRKGNRLVVTLRTGLRFASGRELGARDVVTSLRRSRKRSPALGSIGEADYSSSSPRVVSFPIGDPKELARTLSLPRTAILPHNFSPRHPDSCGALQIDSLGQTLRLSRNTLCPRGGSYFDEVIVESASLIESLRAFEASRADLGFLGKGLHQERKSSQSFHLSDVAQIFVQPGEGLKSFARPGVLNSALKYLPSAPFTALGLTRPHSLLRRWNGPSFALLVSKESPWLVAIAQEIANSWTRPNTRVTVQAVSASEFNRRQKSNDFDARLGSLASTGTPKSLNASDLFALSKRPAPRGGKLLTLRDAARQLPLGWLGALAPHGAIIERVKGLPVGSQLDLANARFEKGKGS